VTTAARKAQRAADSAENAKVGCGGGDDGEPAVTVVAPCCRRPRRSHYRCRSQSRCRQSYHQSRHRRRGHCVVAAPAPPPPPPRWPSSGGDSGGGGGTGVSGGGERGSGSVCTTVRRPRLRTELVERSGTLSSGHVCFERLDLYQYSTRAAYPQQRRTPPPRQSAAADKSSNSRG